MLSTAAPTGFYFTKYKKFPVSCNHIKFTKSGTVIPFNNSISLLLQKATGNLLSCCSSQLSCLCHSKSNWAVDDLSSFDRDLSLKDRLCKGDNQYFSMAALCRFVGYPL